MAIGNGGYSVQQLKKTPIPTPQSGHPFGMAKTPFNPATGKFLALGPEVKPVAATAAASTVQEFTIVAVLDDTLTCTDGAGATVSVLKPYLLRRSTWDEQTFGGITYYYAGLDYRTRDASGGGIISDWPFSVVDLLNGEKVRPAYAVGEKVTGMTVNSQWVDINTGGRTWIVCSQLVNWG